MNLDIFCLLIFCCGILGIFLKNGLLNIIISFQHIIIGIHPFLIILNNHKENKTIIIFLFLLIQIISIFIISLGVLLFRRRSSVNNDELRELRG